MQALQADLSDSAVTVEVGSRTFRLTPQDGLADSTMRKASSASDEWRIDWVTENSGSSEIHRSFGVFQRGRIPRFAGSFLFDDTEQDAIVSALFGWHVVLLGRQSLFRLSLLQSLTLQHHGDVPTAIANHLAPDEVAWLDRLRLPRATRKVWQRPIAVYPPEPGTVSALWLRNGYFALARWGDSRRTIRLASLVIPPPDADHGTVIEPASVTELGIEDLSLVKQIAEALGVSNEVPRLVAEAEGLNHEIPRLVAKAGGCPDEAARLIAESLGFADNIAESVVRRLGLKGGTAIRWFGGSPFPHGYGHGGRPFPKSPRP